MKCLDREVLFCISLAGDGPTGKKVYGMLHPSPIHGDTVGDFYAAIERLEADRLIRAIKNEDGHNRFYLTDDGVQELSSSYLSRVAKLPPCPFCGGPPALSGGISRRHVFCHECGAKSPEASGEVFEHSDLKQIEAAAVALWCHRDNRYGDLYEMCDEDGLNLYPRSDADS